MNNYEVEQHCRPELLSAQPYQAGQSRAAIGDKYGVQVDQIIKLASNENLNGPSPQAIRAIQESAHEAMMYPESMDVNLADCIAKHLGVKAENIVLGNGSNEILELLGHAFLHQPDAEVVFSKHAFLVYALVTQLCSGKAKIAAAEPKDAVMPYGHDLAQIQRQISKNTRLVFIANPNNPTGTWLTRTALAEFLESVPETCLVVIDQAYIEYADGAMNALPLLESFSNLVITQTFSKAYGLAGLRVGYAIALPAVARLLNSIRQPFNVNLLAQKAAVAALEDQEHLNKSIAMNRLGLKQLTDFLKEQKIAYLPSQANFLCIHFGSDSKELYEHLLKQGIIARPIDNYGLPEYLRVTIGQAHQNQILIDTLKQWMA